MAAKSARIVQSIAALAITVILFLFLFYVSDVNRLADAARDADLVYLAFAGPLVVLVTIMRAWRLASLLDRSLDGTVLRISIYHNLIANVVPFRLGEVALPLLLRQTGIERASTALGLLLIIRAVELLVIVAFGGAAAWFAAFAAEALRQLQPLGLVLTIVSATALVLAPTTARNAARFVSSHPRVQESRFSSAILGFAAAFHNVGRRSFARLVAQTAGINIALFLYYALCARAFHAEHDFFGIVAAAAAGAVAFALPINGIAGYGPFEAAWVFTLQFQAVPFEAALVAGFVAHTGATLGLGLMALVALVSAPGPKPVA